MDARSSTLLLGVVPALRAKVAILLAQMAALGHPMTVTDGNRTTAKQQALYAQGRTKPGRIVTYADGVKRLSNHQGGRAVDCTFLNAQGQPHWPEHGPWSEYGKRARDLGLRWGGDWQKPDRPHVEMPS